MNPVRKKRLSLILFLVGGIGLAAVFVLNAFDENMNLYYDPTQVIAGEAPIDHNFRLGGMVKEGTFVREKGSLVVNFEITDYQKSVTVQYEGILPDLFREGQGIITLGKLNASGQFIASEVLAKHDENYMPPEVAESLKTAEKTSPEATAETETK